MNENEQEYFDAGVIAGAMRGFIVGIILSVAIFVLVNKISI